MSENALIEYARNCLTTGRIGAANEAALRILESDPDHLGAQLIQARCSALAGVQMQFNQPRSAFF